MTPPSRPRAIGFALLLVVTLFAAACEDDTHTQRDQLSDSAHDFN